ncbi:MAG: hypothetical protein JWN37_425 [Candidatus Nomurabacteria bacterium]|nr:hypothetical protein [Candidatus Nomurabacteria bacterium]
MIKAIILDIGGVLLLPKDNRKERHLLDSFKEALILLDSFLKTSPETKEQLINIYKESTIGAVTKKETLKEMSDILNIKPKELEQMFHRVYSENIIENIALYEKVLELKKRRYKIGILSTQFHLSKDVLVPKKYYDNFNALEISCDDHLKKPDAKSYTLILGLLNVKPRIIICR